MSDLDLPTKNDSYAVLIAEGRKRGFEVIPEFRVRLPGLHRNKSIDLVWALRPSSTSGFQDKKTLDYWNLVATFEIEACDVRVNKEFKRHLFELPTLTNKSSIVHCVVLYTAAFDRSSLERRYHINDIASRQRAAAAAAYGIRVFAVSDKIALDNLPR